MKSRQQTSEKLLRLTVLWPLYKMKHIEKNPLLLKILMLITLVFTGCKQTEKPIKQTTPAQPQHSFLPDEDFRWPGNTRAAVSLTFDDAQPSQLDVAIPILKKYNVKATFYVLSEYVEQRTSEWEKVAEAGHEIGNHSLNHFCTGNHHWAGKTPLENQTLDTIKYDLRLANLAVESLLDVKPVTFAYPCGQKFVGRGKNVKSYVPVVAEMFLAGRGWLDEADNNPKFCDLAQVMTRQLDQLSFKQAKKLVDDAIEKGHWLVLAGHRVGEPAWLTTNAKTLDKLCKYLTSPDTHIWVDTVASVAAYINQQRANNQKLSPNIELGQKHLPTGPDFNPTTGILMNDNP